MSGYGVEIIPISSNSSRSLWRAICQRLIVTVIRLIRLIRLRFNCRRLFFLSIWVPVHVFTIQHSVFTLLSSDEFVC